MKKIMTLCLTAGMLLGVATGASAVDFQAKGQWVMGFGMVDAQYNKPNGNDTFGAQQRIRLQLDAIASETLSGTVSFEMGDTLWGKTEGGALGADGKIVELRNAYIDWIVPNTELSLRMGIQPLALPSVAGGTAILDDMVAGVVASYKINDMASIGVAWARPYNDNYSEVTGGGPDTADESNFMDNVDLFTVFVPLQGDGWKVTPWVLYGAVGPNAVKSIALGQANGGASGLVASGLLPIGAQAKLDSTNYGDLFYVGLPMGFQFDAWNIELDVNFGSMTGLGDSGNISNNRTGWLIKGLFEYKMDWGTPGLFAWYASGDDGDRENGSEMMPFIDPCGNFTSFLGDGNELGYSLNNNGLGYDQMLSYSGTWGIGAQIKGMSFVEDLSHTIRVAYWGGTNSTAMAKHVGNYNGAFNGIGNNGFYLTETDYLVEVNFDSTYNIYENLDAIVQVGYVFNGVSGETWKNMSEKRDAYKVGLFFNYSF